MNFFCPRQPSFFFSFSVKRLSRNNPASRHLSFSSFLGQLERKINSSVEKSKDQRETIVWTGSVCLFFSQISQRVGERCTFQTWLSGLFSCVAQSYGSGGAIRWHFKFPLEPFLPRRHQFVRKSRRRASRPARGGEQLTFVVLCMWNMSNKKKELVFRPPVAARVLAVIWSGQISSLVEANHVGCGGRPG